MFSGKIPSSNSWMITGVPPWRNGNPHGPPKLLASFGPMSISMECLFWEKLAGDQRDSVVLFCGLGRSRTRLCKGPKSPPWPSVLWSLLPSNPIMTGLPVSTFGHYICNLVGHEQQKPQRSLSESSLCSVLSHVNLHWCGNPNCPIDTKFPLQHHLHLAGGFDLKNVGQYMSIWIVISDSQAELTHSLNQQPEDHAPFSPPVERISDLTSFRFPWGLSSWILYDHPESSPINPNIWQGW